MNDRRKKARRRVLKTGKIVFNDAASVLDCAVRNFSEIGACLMVANGLTIPAEFDLLFDGGRHPCEVAWRQPSRVGVHFSNAPESEFGPKVELRPE